jgi:hypothetical protein
MAGGKRPHGQPKSALFRMVIGSAEMRKQERREKGISGRCSSAEEETRCDWIEVVHSGGDRGGLDSRRGGCRPLR